MRRFWFVSSFFCALTILFLPLKAENTDSIPRLQVRLIKASNEPAELSDPKVNSLNAQLKADFGFKNYQQIFLSESQFIFDEKAVYQMPDDFGITITYKGKRKGQREFFVETEYRGKKFVGFYASFPENAKPVLIRGPSAGNGRYIIALTVG